MSVWPRSGGDRGNRSALSVAGPELRGIAHRLPLPGATPALAGGAVAGDGSLRVVHGATLFAIDPDTWSVRWSCDAAALVLRDDADPDEHGNPEPSEHVPRLSLPAILDGDRTLVTAGGTALIIDAAGALADRVAVPLADASGPSPNLDLAGHPILTTMDGGLHIWRDGRLDQVARGLGYDVVPVAVYDDGSLAVSGYAGRGFCRITETSTVWRSDLRDADKLPTVNRAQCAAVGSVNDGCSALFDPAGRRIATHATVAVFAARDDGDWIALGRRSLARLSPAGGVRWTAAIETAELRWGAYQPIVDAAGDIYIAARDRILAFAGDGRLRASLALGDAVMPLFPVRAGVMATVCGGALVVVA